MKLCLAGFCMFAAAGLYLAVSGEDMRSFTIGALCTAEFGLFATLTWNFVRCLDDHIAVDDSGIWYLPGSGSAVFLKWAEVARVDAHEISKRLVLTDADAVTKIRLEYQLENFAALRSFVLEHALNRESLRSGQRTFHGGYGTLALNFSGVILFIACAIAGKHLSQPRALPLFIALALLSLWGLVFTQRGFTISGNSFSIDYPGWRRTFGFDSVTGITLKNLRGAKGSISAVVELELRTRDPLRLSGYRAGSVAVYDALHRAWMIARGLAPAPADTAFTPPLIALPQPRPRGLETPRLFGHWVAGCAMVAAIIAVYLAPRGIWMRGPAPLSAAQAATLASFPAVAFGWADKPQALFIGASRLHRWNLDYRTGAFSHSQTDLYINDSIPISVSRTYVNRDAIAAFGYGMRISYDMYLTGDSARFTYIDLTLADQTNYHFRRISPGSSWSDAVFRCDDPKVSADDPFSGSKLWWNGNGWTLAVKGALELRFPAVRGQIRPGQGAVVAIADSDGHLLSIERDRRGNILQIESPHGACVRFKRDWDDRITGATDNLGDSIRYRYDDSGRLTEVADSRRGTTHYEYDAANNLIRITKPDGTDWIEVRYDNLGKVVKMNFANGKFIRYAYRTDQHSLVKAVEIFPSSGPSTRVDVNPM